MAIGDIDGDTADTYAARAKQTSFDATNTPAKYLAPPPGQQSLEQLTPPAGPIGRAQQQLPAQPNNLGNIDLTPLDPVAAAQSGPSNLADAFPSALAPQPADPKPAAVTPSPATPPPNQPNNLANISMVTPIPAGPLPPPMTNLAQIGSTIGANALGVASPAAKPQSLADAAPVGVLPMSTNLPHTNPSPVPLPASGIFSADPFTKQQQVAAWNAQFAAKPAASMAVAPPTDPNPVAQAQPASQASSAPTTAPEPASLDIYRSTGAGTDAAGGARAGRQIVAATGPNGEARFSNAPRDQASAQSLGDVISNPAPPAANPNASLASLGSAANLGDGIGTFSQAQPGDAALAMGRFQKAHDLRESYKNEDRRDQALGAQWSADHTNIVHDSSKPLTTGQKQSDAGLDQTRERAANRVVAAQGLVDSGIKDRAGEQQLRQSGRLEDALNAAAAPNATPDQQQRLRTLVDPTGTAGLDRQLKVASIDEKNASTAAKLRNTNKAGNLPVGLQKLEDGDIDAVSNVQSINTQMGNILGQIDDGSLVLGPLENRKNAARNSSGISTPQSANYASFMSSLEKIRNDSLRLNKGPQTEGDANRAWNELLTNVNDPKVVKQRLGEIQAMNNKAAQVRLGMINSRRKNQGVGPLNIDDILGAPQQASQSAQPQQTSTPVPQAPQGSVAQTSAIPQIQNDDDFHKLPSGAQFIDPNGNHRRKP
ncbi:hypothetical protein QN415_11915 [Pseudomonas sp. 5S4]|uniref:hypothetical protein n=1 Tax=Pseudomonas sp. 5S4 TaxID=3048596 RepID=UPI002B2317F4|nr:hypothetical protein [Pseudomonas sp. 5S4]MEB0197912.1 hypothetical protein [Pseudomonas sp. 5S4]